MFRFTRPTLRPVLRRVYSTETPKSTVQLVSELRKLTDAPVLKAREALKECNNDFQAALKWLENDRLTSGTEKAEKVKGRDTKEGLISIHVSHNAGGIEAAMIELNCETDFVSRNEIFAEMARNIARTAASCAAVTFIPRFQGLSVEEILEAQLGGGTVKSGITDLISRTRENVSLRRVASIRIQDADSQYRVGAYIHNPLPAFSFQGRIGALTLCRMRTVRPFSEIIASVERLETSIARQVVGFSPSKIDSPSPEEDVLYHQTFMSSAKEQPLTVREYLRNWEKEWNVDEFSVQDILRWQAGEFVQQR